MWGTYYDEVSTDAVKAAAFQLAVWEVMQETSGSYNIASGNFYLIDSLHTDSNFATYDNLVSYANAYLDSNTWTARANLVTLAANAPGGFVVEIVPEPATMILLCIGGLLLRKRNK